MRMIDAPYQSLGYRQTVISAFTYYDLLLSALIFVVSTWLPDYSETLRFLMTTSALAKLVLPLLWAEWFWRAETNYLILTNSSGSLRYAAVSFVGFGFGMSATYFALMLIGPGSDLPQSWMLSALMVLTIQSIVISPIALGLLHRRSLQLVMTRLEPLAGSYVWLYFLFSAMGIWVLGQPEQQFVAEHRVSPKVASAEYIAISSWFLRLAVRDICVSQEAYVRGRTDGATAELDRQLRPLFWKYRTTFVRILLWGWALIFALGILGPLFVSVLSTFVLR